MASPSLLNCPAGAAQIVDHLIQRNPVSFGKAFRNDGPRIIGVRVIAAVGRIAQNTVQAAVTSFDDIAELVAYEEKGTQVDPGVDLKPSFSRKLMALWCYFIKATPRMTA